VAEAEFDRDPARSINIIMRSSEPVDRVPGLKTSDVLERGGFLVRDGARNEARASAHWAFGWACAEGLARRH